MVDSLFTYLAVGAGLNFLTQKYIRGLDMKSSVLPVVMGMGGGALGFISLKLLDVESPTIFHTIAANGMGVWTMGYLSTIDA